MIIKTQFLRLPGNRCLVQHELAGGGCIVAIGTLTADGGVCCERFEYQPPAQQQQAA